MDDIVLWSNIIIKAQDDVYVFTIGNEITVTKNATKITYRQAINELTSMDQMHDGLEDIHESIITQTSQVFSEFYE